MITHKISLRDCFTGLKKVLKWKLIGTPFSLNLEVTKQCNAKCSFCDYWQTGKEERLDNYLPLIKKFSPIHVSITGGEPLLRKDITNIIRQIKQGGFVYLSLITNGHLLTEKKALEIWSAGLHQIGISLDFLDERHDGYRGIKGLYKHLGALIPRLAQNPEIDNISIQTIIMEENLDQVIPIAEKAAEWGVKVSYSTYCAKKNFNDLGRIKGDQVKKLREVIDKLLKAKKRLGNIISSDFYLSKIPEYFENGGITGCLAGRKWIQVTPNGDIKQCADMPVAGKWTDFHRGFFKKTDCAQCWYSCRGEAQNPLTPKRIMELSNMK